LDGGSENTSADRGQNFQWRPGLLQFITEADAQIPGNDLKHLPAALSHPQALIPGSSGNNRALAENQREEFEKEKGLRGVLVKIGPNCGQNLFARHKDAILRSQYESLDPELQDYRFVLLVFDHKPVSTDCKGLNSRLKRTPEACGVFGNIHYPGAGASTFTRRFGWEHPLTRSEIMVKAEPWALP